MVTYHLQRPKAPAHRETIPVAAGFAGFWTCLRRTRGISLHGTRSIGRLLRQELAQVSPFEAILFLIGPDLNRQRSRTECEGLLQRLLPNGRRGLV